MESQSLKQQFDIIVQNNGADGQKWTKVKDVANEQYVDIIIYVDLRSF